MTRCCVLSLLTLWLGACALGTEKIVEVREEPTPRPTTVSFSIPCNASGRMCLDIVNVLGVVALRPSSDNDTHVVVRAMEGDLPECVELKEVDGVPRLYVLDDQNIVKDPAPELPRLDHEGRIFRLNQRLNRCDVLVDVPANTFVEVVACAKLEVAASAHIVARARNGAHVWSGQGRLDIDVIDGPLLVENASYAVVASIGGLAEFRGVVGDKSIRGQGNVIVHGGQGMLNIDIDGDVWADTVISPGYARSSSAGTHDIAAHGLMPLGPRKPDIGVEQLRSEGGAIANRIRAREVELRIPCASSLDVSLAASDGAVELDLPAEARAVIHEHSSASARLTLGKADGELIVAAVQRAELVVLKP